MSYQFCSRAVPEGLTVTSKQPTLLFKILNSIKYMKPTFVKLAILKCLPGDRWWTVAMENLYKAFMLFQHTEKSDFFTTFQVKLGRQMPKRSWKQMRLWDNHRYSSIATKEFILRRMSEILHSLIFPLSPHLVPLLSHCFPLILSKWESLKSWPLNTKSSWLLCFGLSMQMLRHNLLPALTKRADMGHGKSPLCYNHHDPYSSNPFPIITISVIHTYQLNPKPVMATHILSLF